MPKTPRIIWQDSLLDLEKAKSLPELKKVLKHMIEQMQMVHQTNRDDVETCEDRLTAGGL